jgi:hypothetical protein
MTSPGQGLHLLSLGRYGHKEPRGSSSMSQSIPQGIFAIDEACRCHCSMCVLGRERMQRRRRQQSTTCLSTMWHQHARDYGVSRLQAVLVLPRLPHNPVYPLRMAPLSLDLGHIGCMTNFTFIHVRDYVLRSLSTYKLTGFSFT